MGGRRTCTNGHKLEYFGIIMAQHYSQKKGEFLCVDWERAFHKENNNGSQNGALLYTTEMEGAPLMRRPILTTTRFRVRCAHRAYLCTSGGVRPNVLVARQNCTTASWRVLTTRTTVAVTTSCACTLRGRSLMVRAVATTTVRCCTVWSMRTQVRWTRTTIRMPRASCVSRKVLLVESLTYSGAVRPVRAVKRLSTMA